MVVLHLEQRASSEGLEHFSRPFRVALAMLMGASLGVNAWWQQPLRRQDPRRYAARALFVGVAMSFNMWVVLVHSQEHHRSMHPRHLELPHFEELGDRRATAPER